MYFYFARMLRKIIACVRSSALDRQLAEEIETHRSLLNDGLKKRSTEGKDQRALMGNITLAEEESRDVWRFRYFDSVSQDVRHAVRGLLRTPAFTITAIISLALGIGANTAIFTAVSTIFFKPLPVSNPSALVTFATTDARGQIRQYYPLAFARQLRSSGAFSDVVATVSDGLSFQYGGDRTERIMGEVVTPNFFSALGIKTVAGQGFTHDVKQGKWAAEAVLSYSYWKARFDGDPAIIGRAIRLNTFPFTVVGVSAPSFYDLHQGQDPELRIPVLPPGRTLSELNILSPNQDDFSIMARLAPGVNRPEAQAAAAAQLREFVRSSSNAEIRRVGYRQLRLLPGDRGWPELAGDFRTPLVVLFLLVFVVLLIACANVANMSLARAGTRRREFAVRTALGAGRGRLVQQLITESLLLAGFGGLVGWLVACYAAQFLLYFLPHGHINFVLDLRPEARALIFTVALSILAALLFGATSAYQTTRGNLATGLKSDSNGSIGATGTYLLKKILITCQIAFSLALLVIAGLFVRTVFNLRPKADFPNPSRIIVFTMKPQEEIYSPDRIRSVIAELIRRVSAVPGVNAVSLAEDGPFASRQNSVTFQVPGKTPLEASKDSVLPNFFRTLRVPILAGRDFTPADKPGSPKVVIVNKSLANALFPYQNALGRVVEIPFLHDSQLFRVIGVVGDFHYYDPRRESPAAFFAFQDDPPYMPTLHVCVASAHAEAYVPSIRHVFDAVNKGFPVFDVRTLKDRIDDALDRERMVADLSTVFGGLALALAVIGLYGLFAYSVTQRTREIGLRMALGSNIRQVLWLVIREALLLVAAGIAFGSAVAVGGAYLLGHQLYGVAPADPLTLLGSTALMIAITLLAVSIPAWKASRIDPMITLRHD